MSLDIAIAQVNGESLYFGDVVRAMGAADNLGFFSGFARRMLIRQLAVREGIAVSQEELQRQVDEWRYKHRLERVEDTEAWLAQRGISFQDVVAEVEFQRLEHLLAVRVSQDEIKPFFAQHRMDFDEADVCWIFSRAEEVADELALNVRDGGADFCAMARAHSEDEITRPAGGYLGRLRRGQLPKGISPRVFALSEGEALGPEKVPGGYALYALQRFYPAGLNDRVRKEIRKRIFQQWLQREMRHAKISFCWESKR